METWWYFTSLLPFLHETCDTFVLKWNHCLSFTLPSNHGLVISAFCHLLVHPLRRKSLFMCDLSYITLSSSLLLGSRCSSGYVCPTGMRVPPLGIFCDGDEFSVRGGVTGSTAHLRPPPSPPRCSGPTGRPLHDRGYIQMQLLFLFHSSQEFFVWTKLPPCPWVMLEHQGRKYEVVPGLKVPPLRLWPRLWRIP